MVSGRLELVVRTAKTSAISTEIRQFPTSVSGSMLNRIQSSDDVSTSKGGELLGQSHSRNWFKKRGSNESR
jgi:hypothetical protein